MEDRCEFWESGKHPPPPKKEGEEAKAEEGFLSSTFQVRNDKRLLDIYTNSNHFCYSLLKLDWVSPLNVSTDGEGY
jgi:hypothetical protein